MRVAIYCRFSVESSIKDQTKDSLTHQKEEGIKFCNKNGYEYKIFEDVDGRDVSFLDRKSGNRLLNDIEDKIIDGVWVLREDRIGELSSAIGFKTILMRYSIKYFVDDREIDFNNDGDFMGNMIQSMMSTMDRRGIKKRVYRGIKDRVIKKGLLIGNHPFGFIPNKKEIQIDEEKKKVIADVYRCFVDREWESIRDWILYCQNIIDLFRKRHYNGEKLYRLRDGNVTIKLPKFVSDKLFNKAMEKANKMIEFGKGNNNNKDFINILNGLVYCKVCGKKCNIHYANRKKGRRSLRCRYGKDLKGNKINLTNQPKKHTTTFYYNELSNSIYVMLVNLLFNSNIIKDEYKRLYGSKVNISTYKKDIKNIDKQLKSIQTKTLTIEDKMLDGLISEENVLIHKEKLSLKKLMLEGKKESLVDDINKITSSNTILSWIGRFKKEYSIKNMMNKSDKEKQKIIHTYIKKIKLLGSIHKGYEIEIELNIPIYNDKIKINKKRYWEFVNNGGNKRKWKKEWVIEDGSSKFLYDVGWDNMDEKTTNKLLLDNSNISSQYSNTLLNFNITIKHTSNHIDYTIPLDKPIIKSFSFTH